MIKWIALGIVLLVVAALAVMSFMTRETRVSDAPSPQLEPCPPSPNCVSSLAPGGEHRVEPLSLIDGDPAASWQRLLSVIEQHGGELVRRDAGYAHAVFTSALFRFKDDLEVVLSSDHIDIRSASRAGRSDLGKNRQRVESIRQEYHQ
jgi:uncharacterized protein (DUF1499 family)